jgi:hypothetical protein
MVDEDTPEVDTPEMTLAKQVLADAKALEDARLAALEKPSESSEAKPSLISKIFG